MITLKIKTKNDAHKTARATNRASKLTLKSVPRSPTKKISGGEATSWHSAARSRANGTPPSPDELDKIDAYWRAANYVEAKTEIKRVRAKSTGSNELSKVTDRHDIALHLMHLTWSSPGPLAIAPLQDLLNPPVRVI